MLAVVASVLPASPVMAIEEPVYQSIERAGAFELREYAPYLIAETSVESGFMAAGNIAFGRLFRYISGANVPGKKIAMTAPVTQAPGEKIAMTAPVQQVAAGEGYLVGFVVPRQYTLETVPRPTDPRVRIREVPGGLVAAWRYSGRWTESNFRRAESRLRNELGARRLVPVGEALIARYDAPFMPPFLRRNEVLIPVRRGR